MKIQFVFLFAASLLLFACVSETTDAKKTREKTVIPVPEAFKADTAIAHHMNELSENLDAFALMVEEMADEIDALHIKDLKKPGITEKLQLMQIVLPKVTPMMELAEKIQKLDKTSEGIKDTLPQERLEAFLKFEEAFKGRFDTLNLRFRSYLTEDSLATQ